MAEPIDLDFGTKATFRLFYTVLYRNSGILKNKHTSLQTFIPNSNLENFAIARRPSQVSAAYVDTQVWSPVGSLSHWVSTIVHNIMGVRQRVAQVCLRQLGLLFKCQNLFLGSLLSTTVMVQVKRSIRCVSVSSYDNFWKKWFLN